VDTVTRRRFLKLSGVVGAGALAAGAATITWEQLATAATHDPLPTGSGVLVLFTMYGGNDGLNTVIPFDDPAYHDARPELAYAADQVQDLGTGTGTAALGLNPALRSLHGLWQASKLAVVRGVGYPQPNLSHFVSMDIWQTASPTDPEGSGWLGRWLDTQPDDQLRPLRAVSLGGVLPPLLAGTACAGSALPTGPFRLPSGPARTALQGFGQASSSDPDTIAYAARDVDDLLTVAGTFAHVLDHGTTTGSGMTGGTPAPGMHAGGTNVGGASSLAQQLDIVATCIEARVPTQVYAVSLGNFDTHAAENPTQSKLLTELDAALGAFQQRVAATPHANDVVLAAYTEFGRRVAGNANEGTDHGTAGPVLVIGESVRGGAYGEQPSLTDLDDGNLKYSTDFRSVYATLLDRVLGADPGRVLGQAFPTIALL
jgi:uncharacterized protein (DUF1501 family)